MLVKCFSYWLLVWIYSIHTIKSGTSLSTLSKWSRDGSSVCTFSSLFPETEDSCKVCCRGKDGLCSPFIQTDDTFIFLRKGKPCTVGFCDGTVRRNFYTFSINGTKTNGNFTLSRLWKFLHMLKCVVLWFETGKVHEAGAGRHREAVGFYWQAGH